jgi:hypothetical protein
MAEKSVVSEETETDGVVDDAVDDVLPLVPGVVVFFDELHAASPAAVTTATDQMQARFVDNFIHPPPMGLNVRDGTEVNVNKL